MLALEVSCTELDLYGIHVVGIWVQTSSFVLIQRAKVQCPFKNKTPKHVMMHGRRTKSSVPPRPRPPRHVLMRFRMQADLLACSLLFVCALGRMQVLLSETCSAQRAAVSPPGQVPVMSRLGSGCRRSPAPAVAIVCRSGSALSWTCVMRERLPATLINLDQVQRHPRNRRDSDSPHIFS